MCTCREEAASPCGASTTGMNRGDERVALNIGMLVVPLFFLFLLRRGLIRKWEAIRVRSSS